MDNNISTTKLEKFKQTLSARNKEIVSTVVKNTLYITTDELVEMVKANLIKFINEHPKYNLYIPMDKISSEHYLMLKLEALLNPVCVIKDTNYLYAESLDTKITNDYPILIIDDAIYSSNNMCSHIDGLRTNKILNDVYCIVGVLSSHTVQVARDFNAKIISHYVLDDKMICNLFEDYNLDYFNIQFGCETQYILPVFFEHKIANEFGSYDFYHKICEKPVNRSPIDSIRVQDVVEFIKRLKLKVV